MAWSNFKFLPILLFPLVLSSCSEEIHYEARISLQSQYNIQETILLNDLLSLERMINSQNTFLLYIYSHSCSACEIYTPIINNYVKNNQVIMYSIDVANETTKLRPDNGLVNFLETPTLILFDSGSIIFKASPSYTTKPFLSSNDMKEYIEEYAYISPFIQVNNEQDLDLLINNNEEKILYFYYSKCGDCTYFESHFLNKYFTRVNAKKIYGFEMSYYFDNRVDSSSPVFKNFVDKYGLSRDGNKDFGYNNGVVPTLQKYNKNELINACVIFNDEFEKKYDSNNEIVGLKIISSYYEDSKFIGKTYINTEKDTALNLYHKETLDFFIEKFNEIV